jgi:hypothetical protein
MKLVSVVLVAMALVGAASAADVSMGSHRIRSRMALSRAHRARIVNQQLRSEYAEKAKKTMQDSLAANDEFHKQEQAKCTKEIAETDKWLAEGQSAAAKGKDGVNGLLDALRARIASLKTVLAMILDMLKHLDEHILRVNDAFGIKYKQNLNDLKHSSTTLNQLGLLVTEPESPLIHPIKTAKEAGAVFDDSLPASPSSNATTLPQMQMQGGDAQTTAFIEVPANHEFSRRTGAIELRPSMRFSELTAGLEVAVPQQCTDAYKTVFGVYSEAHMNHMESHISFEKERVILKNFRDALIALAARKRARLAALEAQLKALEALAAKKEKQLSDILADSLALHKKVITESCTRMSNEHKKAQEVKTKVITSIQGCGQAAPGDAQGATGAAAQPAQPEATAQSESADAPAQPATEGESAAQPAAQGEAAQPAAMTLNNGKELCMPDTQCPADKVTPSEQSAEQFKSCKSFAEKEGKDVNVCRTALIEANQPQQ